jgi:hypothetical protein
VIGADAVTNFGWAWLAATIALGLHVVDETAHNFLAWYNPRALRIRRRLGGVPFPPTFTFLPWLLGLLAVILILGALTPHAYGGQPWLRPLGYCLAGIHIANGLVHMMASVLARRPVPGVLSAPVLLMTGSWLGYVAARLP